jgi:hypothetical protein
MTFNFAMQAIDRVQTSESGTNGDTTEAGLCDGSIDNPLGTEAVEVGSQPEDLRPR